MIDIKQYEFFHVQRDVYIAVINWHTFLICYKLSGIYDQKYEVWETNRTTSVNSFEFKGSSNPNPDLHKYLIVLSEKTNYPSYLYTTLISSGELSILDWDWIRTNQNRCPQHGTKDWIIYFEEQNKMIQFIMHNHYRDKKIDTLLDE